MIDDNEMLLMLRLEPLDRSAKTAFAAACAQRLVHLSNRYSQQVGDSLREQRLAVIVSAASQAAAGRGIDATRMKAEAEAMVPDEDEEGWSAGRTYAGNAAAAAAYALRTWLTNDPQEAAWAARQLLDTADLAYSQAIRGGDLTSEDEEKAYLESPVFQSVTFAIQRDLEAIETGRSWSELRQRAELEGKDWVASMP
ncbi:hypothetical protein [Arthrobacter sp. Soil763]|uniref:hypothetical protein n=1 Tax=Arthrobacter sp. Soil763 TaxID=1736402 RepID=UPI0006F4A369|nr:hypothetical protein [Arthrobacter sp. Soil763]KRE79769.1 hypothetical protein ASG71_06890 [Arthrobacter sp. Soil763]